MLSRKIIFALILLLLVFGGFGTWLAKAPAQLYSNPATIRTNDNYLRAHGPGTNAPPLPTNLFSSLLIERVERATPEITIKIPTRGPANDFTFGPIRDHLANASHFIRLENGSVNLAYVATAYASPKTNFDYSVQLPATFYSPDLKPLPPDHPVFSEPNYERDLNFEGDFPAAVFYFTRTNVDDFKALRFDAFDARTHFPLTSGYGSSSLSNLFWFSCSPRLWHQTPIELVVHAATGPVQTYSIPVREGAELQYPGGAVRLLLLEDQDLRGWSSNSDGRTNKMTFQIKRPLATERPVFSLVFYSWPAAFNAPFEIECLGADGKPFASRGGGSSERLNTVSYEGRLSDIKEIRFKYFPNIHRLSFTIPEFPGLPEQNRNIKNLFDVHVPFMRFQYEYAFQDNIANLVQMQNHHAALTFTNGFFPTARYDTTPRELFHEMETMLSDQQLRLVANPTANKIEPAPNSARILFRRFRKSIGLD